MNQKVKARRGAPPTGGGKWRARKKKKTMEEAGLVRLHQPATGGDGLRDQRKVFVVTEAFVNNNNNFDGEKKKEKREELLERFTASLVVFYAFLSCSLQLKEEAF